jgi:hypothetical protein
MGFAIEPPPEPSCELHQKIDRSYECKTRPLSSAICGRPADGKHCLAPRTIGSIAAICRACLRGSISPLTLMKSDDRDPPHVSELFNQ